jgi:molybdopterin/thiamine biosynthesis adenylyltransferase
LDGRKVLPDELMLDFGLAGVGAVGCAVLQALWACPGLAGRAVIADGDSEGVDVTNLNRCAIFAHRHIGLPKASTAAALLEDCGITWAPVDGLYAQGRLPWVPPTLLSAVDTNRSRISLQEGFWPGRLLGASTLDLRAEVCRFGPAGIGPCLCCFNPPELAMPDDLRRDRLREEGDEAMATLAEKVGCSLEDVRAWVEKGECGEVEAAVLSELRATDEQDRSFSVGFVSVFAGVALAAELVKETAGWQTPLNDEFGEANFQFLRPTAEENGNPRQVQRDPACRHCESGSAALDVWRGRETRWTPPSREQVV